MMSEDRAPAATNISWQPDPIGRVRRERVSGHRGAVVWFTGLSGAGKTTIARGVEAALGARRVHAYVIDSENVRHGLSADLGFSPEERREHLRRLGEVARMFADAGVIALVSVISPYRAMRRRIRELVGPDFLEVHVATPLAVCESRDPRGLYARARIGLIPDFTGVSAPYEEPEDAELVLHPENEPVEASVRRVVSFLDNFAVLEVPR